MKGQIIKNSNGLSYEILAQEGSYTLLQCTTKALSPYVVAWCLNEYEGGWSWGQGHYFANLGNAWKLYREKTR
jgi:hypothetical protein